MSMRAMAIMAPGMFLSQPPMASRPSMLSALQAVSIESAITSRETREYFMPSVPMEMPSLTVMVPKVCGIAPAARSADSARVASTFRPRLQGVMVEYAFATPTMGLSKSASPNPTARSMARLGARCAPAVTIRLRRSSGIDPPSREPLGIIARPPPLRAPRPRPSPRAALRRCPCRRPRVGGTSA